MAQINPTRCKHVVFTCHVEPTSRALLYTQCCHPSKIEWGPKAEAEAAEVRKEPYHIKRFTGWDHRCIPAAGVAGGPIGILGTEFDTDEKLRQLP